MLSPASGPAVLHRGNAVVSLYVQTASSLWKSSLDGLASSHELHLTLSGAPKMLSRTVRSIGSLQYSPPWMKNHVLNEKKPYRRKNNLSIASSEVNVWLVWILTTKRKSFKREETCEKNHNFTFWLFVMLTGSSDLIFQTVFTHWICIYIHVICSALNPWLFIRIWMTSFLSRIWKDT